MGVWGAAHNLLVSEFSLTRLHYKRQFVPEICWKMRGEQLHTPLTMNACTINLTNSQPF